MSAVDERRAVQALAYRLREWNVDQPEAKAGEFIAALVNVGWVMGPGGAVAPRPPKPHEACRTCGRAMHAPDVVCDQPTTRPPIASVPPPVTYLDARRARPADQTEGA